ncbi:MAG TPA: DNA mismatch endonuclease Vsr [Ramlibacter sp.]|uniref:very short patch repair endonuclease n=1 Tax=Ramlibacter sp. TaxID=1917967 RepID=UPI002ED56C55
MVDRLTPERRTALMKAVKTKNTAPELAVRSLLHRMGYRFRLHRKDLPGTPDIVLPKYRSVILVHGCFWHAHGCHLGRAPKSKLEYWQPKLNRNKERDVEKGALLKMAGWRVLTVWQCETSNQERLERRLRRFLER